MLRSLARVITRWARPWVGGEDPTASKAKRRLEDTVVRIVPDLQAPGVRNGQHVFSERHGKLFRWNGVAWMNAVSPTERKEVAGLRLASITPRLVDQVDVATHSAVYVTTPELPRTSLEALPCCPQLRVTEHGWELWFTDMDDGLGLTIQARTPMHRRPGVRIHAKPDWLVVDIGGMVVCDTRPPAMRELVA